MFCLVVTATACWIIFVPGEYESTAKVYVRVGRENNTLDPSATTGQTVNIQQTLESEINSMLQILESRETAERVVAEVGVDLILANDIPDKPSADSTDSKKASGPSWLSRIKGTVLPTRFDETPQSLAVKAVQKRMTSWAPKKANVIEISYRSGHPKLSQMVTKSITRAFIEEHLRVTQTEGSLLFFVSQTEQLKERLTSIEEELTEAKSSSSLVSIEGQQAILEEQAKSIRTRTLTNNSLLESSQAKVKKIGEILEVLPLRVEADQTTAENHPGWYSLREKLFDLQIREHELKSKYSSQNSEVIAVIEQRKAVEAIMEAQSNSASESISSTNPTHLLFQQSLLNEQALVAALMAEQESLAKQQEQNLVEYRMLNENALRIGGLERQRLIVETSYLASAAKTDQATILQGLETAKISNMSELQSASFDAQPAGIGRLKTLLLGIFAGLFLGCGVAGLTEYFDRTFVTARQVENALEVPVLVSIPQGRRQIMEAS